MRPRMTEADWRHIKFKIVVLFIMALAVFIKVWC